MAEDETALANCGTSSSPLSPSSTQESELVNLPSTQSVAARKDHDSSSGSEGECQDSKPYISHISPMHMEALEPEIVDCQDFGTADDGHSPTRHISQIAESGPTQSHYGSRTMVTYPVGQHGIVSTWIELSKKLLKLLKKMNVKTLSVDINRKGYSDDPSPPVVVVISNLPGSLSASNTTTVNKTCRKLLDSYNLTNVKVEFRHEVIIHC